jgi:DNA-binding NarL/FixJ family response regulator
MLKVGIVCPSDTAFDAVPLILGQIDSVCFNLASARYEFFFELLSHVEIDIAIVCIQPQNNKPLEIMSLIRTTYPAIKILGISHTSNPFVRQAAMEHGAFDVLSLPVTEQRLENAILDAN